MQCEGCIKCQGHVFFFLVRIYNFVTYVCLVFSWFYLLPALTFHVQKHLISAEVYSFSILGTSILTLTVRGQSRAIGSSTHSCGTVLTACLVRFVLVGPQRALFTDSLAVVDACALGTVYCKHSKYSSCQQRQDKLTLVHTGQTRISCQQTNKTHFS